MVFQFLLRKLRMSTVSRDKVALFILKICPAVENALFKGTDVGTIKTFFVQGLPASGNVSHYRANTAEFLY